MISSVFLVIFHPVGPGIIFGTKTNAPKMRSNNAMTDAEGREAERPLSGVCAYVGADDFAGMLCVNGLGGLVQSVCSEVGWGSLAVDALSSVHQFSAAARKGITRCRRCCGRSRGRQSTPRLSHHLPSRSRPRQRALQSRLSSRPLAIVFVFIQPILGNRYGTGVIP